MSNQVTKTWKISKNGNPESLELVHTDIFNIQNDSDTDVIFIFDNNNEISKESGDDLVKVICVPAGQSRGNYKLDKDCHRDINLLYLNCDTTSGVAQGFTRLIGGPGSGSASIKVND